MKLSFGRRHNMDIAIGIFGSNALLERSAPIRRQRGCSRAPSQVARDADESSDRRNLILTCRRFFGHRHSQRLSHAAQRIDEINHLIPSGKSGSGSLSRFSASGSIR